MFLRCNRGFQEFDARPIQDLSEAFPSNAVGKIMVQTAIHHAESLFFGIDSFEFSSQLRPTAQFATHYHAIALGIGFEHAGRTD
jgi:hypothetical protein